MKATEKHKLIERIRTIKGLTDEERSELLKLLQEHKKYGLVWENKPEDVEERLREELPVLTEVKDRAIISDNTDAPNHILIEGDNLEALTTLAYTHEGKIDVIYIDPPYNTGNKDFVYYDDFSDDYRTLPYVEKEDAYRHSKWLSFMSRRLKIAKKLLSPEGVIFISIDDNEQANLKLLCDEIFGQQNFISKFDWRKKTGANDAKDIAVITESILCYSKNKFLAIQLGIWNRDRASRNDNRFKFSDDYVDVRGKYYLDTLDRGGLQYSDSLNFGIEAPDGGVIFPHGRNKYLNDGWIWKWSKAKIEWGIENGFVEFVESKKSKGSKYTIKYKVYELVDNEGKPKSDIGRAFSNLITEPINQQGNSDISNIFDGLVPFPNPKPIGLIQYLLSTLKWNCALDFFAGSGTTLHAVMQLNAEEDGSHRTCILCTNNENNICEEVTYERNKRVIQGYTKPNGEEVAGLHNNNLRYYRTDFISRSRSTKNMRRLVRLATDMLCIKENLYTEQKTFAGMSTFKNIYRFFDDGKKQMLVIYDERYVAEIVKFIEKTDFENKIKVYVFSPSEDPWEVDFEPVIEKVTLCALPQAIYNTYKRILPKTRNKPLVSTDEDALGQSEDEDLGGVFSQKGGEE